MEKEGLGPRGMKVCGQEGRVPTWAVAPTRRRSYLHSRCDWHIAVTQANTRQGKAVDFQSFTVMYNATHIIFPRPARGKM
jgi:hypothetical protein